MNFINQHHRRYLVSLFTIRTCVHWYRLVSNELKFFFEDIVSFFFLPLLFSFVTFTRITRESKEEGKSGFSPSD